MSYPVIYKQANDSKLNLKSMQYGFCRDDIRLLPPSRLTHALTHANVPLKCPIELI